MDLSQKKLFLLDLDGTLYLEETLLPGAAEFLESAEKEYIAGLRLGTVTDTQDTSGTVLETHPVTVTRADVQAALQRFLGPIEQIPPMYSAIKPSIRWLPGA